MKRIERDQLNETEQQTISGSDSEDNSDINGAPRTRPSKSCQYNFLVQLGMIL